MGAQVIAKIVTGGQTGLHFDMADNRGKAKANDDIHQQIGDAHAPRAETNPEVEDEDLSHDEGSLSALNNTLSLHETRHAERHRALMEGHVEMVTEMRQMKSTMETLAAQLTRWMDFQMKGKEQEM